MTRRVRSPVARCRLAVQAVVLVSLALAATPLATPTVAATRHRVPATGPTQASSPSSERSRPPVELFPPDPEAVAADSGPVAFEHADPAEELASESLGSGQAMWRGDVVRSSNRQYRLVMQGDGNLVLYFKSRAVWSSGTAGHPGAHAVMQGDGNLVIYAPHGGPALWYSGTGGHPGAFLAVQTDANVVVYSTAQVALWSSSSFNNRLDQGERLKPGYVLYAPDRAVRLEMQGDGNLVVYGGNRALWNSGTSGHPGAYTVMQGDGNFVVYSESTRALWSSGSAGRGGARLALQGDGNLVVYPASEPAVWNAQSFVDRLAAGRGLTPGQFLVSDSGAHTLQMQGDGNLVVYSGGRAVWTANTAGHAGAHLEMQGDGNLVVYPRQARPCGLQTLQATPALRSSCSPTPTSSSTPADPRSGRGCRHPRPAAA